MYTDNALLFPRHAIPALKSLRGPEWQALVERVLALPETHEETLAFMLMMIRLNGCLDCETDSYRAMRGCAPCAQQTLRRYKGRDTDLLVNIISMSLARASAPTGRKDVVDSSYRRFAKTAVEIITDLERTGYHIMPDEATPFMVSAGVAETAERSTGSSRTIGADPEYVKKLYHNVVNARPDDCRPRAK